jgi:hypothetical protein
LFLVGQDRGRLLEALRYLRLPAESFDASAARRLKIQLNSS